MPRPIARLAFASVLLAAGCTTTRTPTTATTLEPKIQAKVKKGVIKPGFTPEMVYLALGKPSVPADSLVDATTDGTWIYADFHPPTDRGLVRAGYRIRVVADASRRGPTTVTEPLDPKSPASLGAPSLHVTFHNGRVVEIQHVAAR